MDIARKIKTYDISSDCMMIVVIFIPKHPVIKPTISKALREEANGIWSRNYKSNPKYWL